MHKIYITPWELIGNEVINPIVNAVDDIKSHGAACSIIYARSNPDGVPSKDYCLVTVKAVDGYPWARLESLPGVASAPVVNDYSFAYKSTGKINKMLVPYGLEAKRGMSYADMWQDVAKQINTYSIGFNRYLLGFKNKPRPKGTFSDGFTAAIDERLDVRTGWSVADGTANTIGVVASLGTIRTYSVGDKLTLYACPDQGSADNYVQARLKTVTSFGQNALVTRAVDKNNYLMWYMGGSGGSGSRLAKCVAGVYTSLFTHQGIDESVYKIEVNGTTAILFEDGIDVSGAQVYAENTTETSQGLVTRAASSTAWLDDFEAGTLGGGGAPTASLLLMNRSVANYGGMR